MPSAVNTASKELVNLPARSLIRNLTEAAVAEVHQDVAGCLGRPGAVRVRGDADQVNPAGAPVQRAVHMGERLTPVAHARNAGRPSAQVKLTHYPGTQFHINPLLAIGRSAWLLLTCFRAGCFRLISVARGASSERNAAYFYTQRPEVERACMRRQRCRAGLCGGARRFGSSAAARQRLACRQGGRRPGDLAPGTGGQPPGACQGRRPAGQDRQPRSEGS